MLVQHSPDGQNTPNSNSTHPDPIEPQQTASDILVLLVANVKNYKRDKGGIGLTSTPRPTDSWEAVTQLSQRWQLGLIDDVSEAIS